MAQQAERTKHGTHRPLLETADPRGRLAELMEVREPLYRAVATVTVRTDRRKVLAVAEDIVARLSALEAPLE